MDDLLSVKNLKEWEIYLTHQTGKNVWPKDSCPNYLPRSVVMADRVRQCWYCRYADFHLQEEIALEVGICCFPNTQN